VLHSCPHDSFMPAGALQIPYTSGLLVGIGEPPAARLRDLLLLRTLHAEHGHIQELIIQNFCPKPATRMANASPPPAEEHLRVVAMARLVFGPDMSIQAPPNLSADATADSAGDLVLHALLAAGTSPCLPCYGD
jgi:FO synthase